MIILVTGGSGSGKSAHAEDIVTTLGAGSSLYYLATMQVFDEEGKKKIKRHQDLRAGKGFTTIEQPIDIGSAAEKISECEKLTEKMCKFENENSTGKVRTETVVLLECMSNLVANEMFSNIAQNSNKSVEDRIVSGIHKLDDICSCLVIVTNNVFEDGITYEPSTMEYIKVLGDVNRKLASLADQVIEVVAGIPVKVKDKL